MMYYSLCNFIAFIFETFSWILGKAACTSSSCKSAESSSNKIILWLCEA